MQKRAAAIIHAPASADCSLLTGFEQTPEARRNIWSQPENQHFKTAFRFEMPVVV